MMRSSVVGLPRTPVRRRPFNKENSEALSSQRNESGRELYVSRSLSEPPKVRVRSVFTSVNASRQYSSPIGEAVDQSVSTPCRAGNSDDSTSPVSMTKEDVEALLHMKMKGKGKFDFKGKSEQMMEYIRKLRTCIRWLQELEAEYISEKEQLYHQLLEQKKSHEVSEELLRAKHDELRKELLDIKIKCSALEDKLAEAESERESLLADRENDSESLKLANAEITRLTADSEAHEKDIDNANEQISALQEINKKLQEYNASLQVYNAKMQSDAAMAAETISKIQKEKSSMMETLSSLRGHSVSLQEQLNQAKASMQEGANQRKLLMDEQEKLRVELLHSLEHEKKQSAELEELTVEITECKDYIRNSDMELEAVKEKLVSLEQINTSQAEEMTSLREEMSIANQKLQMVESKVVQQQYEDAEKKVVMKDLQQRLADAELRVREGELLRRKLHNTILELKGNVRVFCRVRPLLPEDESFMQGEPPALFYPTSAELLGRGIELVQSQGQRHAFTFDKVFGPEAGQDDVFMEISQLIQSALDGYKVCIFAYGQTGSGKTHTMLGDPDDFDQMGVIPRSLEQIFKSSEALSFQGWTFQMQASMLEIYNETIRDLLVPGNRGGTPSKAYGNGTPSKQYTIKHDPNGMTSVSDLTVVEVSKWEEVSCLLRQASQSRAVGKTAINDQSSRSHCVFTLRISGFNESINQEVNGILNLIDLAGSERLSRSGSVGDRLKETQAINKSLASLGDVILAIANRDQHVPYRNSKLTYFLQPCLGGDSKTLMFVNVSPDAKCANETLCSLRFAAKVNACDIGVPRRNTHTLSYQE